MLSVTASAQVNIDSSRLLKTVVVKQSRLNDYVIAAYELPLDSTVLALASNGSLTDLLRKQGFGHIRTYGPNGLASPAFRGTGSSHTSVLWNGINLVSPLSGQLDLSLVPAGLFDDASIQTGGSTSLSGNGSIGANIHLNNNLNFNEGLRASVASHIGSFGNRYYDVGLRFSNKKFGSATKIFVNAAENDFKFTDRTTFQSKVKRREHAAFDQQGILQQLHWQAAKLGILSLKFWYQQSYYEIPNATTVIATSQATEENKFYRTVAQWNYNKKNFELNYQGAFLAQSLDYTNPVRNEKSLNRYNSSIHNVEGNFDFENEAQLTSGIHYTWEQGLADNFGLNTPVRNRVALFSAFKFSPFTKWKFALSAREELVSGKTTPFAPTVSAKYIVNRAVEVFANVSRNYRLPTFNDLYWQGSGARGNPNLKAELSLGGETGISVTHSNTFFKTVLFSNHVDNWILWNINQDRAWTPQNIKEVWSRGIETQLSVDKKLGSIESKLIGQYSFTMATNESIYKNGNLNEQGKQLLLTPKHEGSLTGEAAWRKYALRVVGSFTGEQFNDSDNSPYNVLPSYLITNLWLRKHILYNHFGLTLTAEINNLFNVDYQARPGYPLPGINYKAGIQINFNKPTKQ